MPTCERCGRDRHRSEYRYWSGSYSEAVDGAMKYYKLLCDSCHWELERQ